MLAEYSISTNCRVSAHYRKDLILADGRVKQARETAMDVLQKSLLGTDARVVRNEALLSRGSLSSRCAASSLSSMTRTL
jgi:hypothetical protein